jgi:hypothetical protein
MKKIIISVAAVILTVVSSAQTLNLSGSFKLNPAKSKLNADFSMAPKEMTIEQTASDLNIEKHTDFQGQEMTTKDKVTFDGKECINAGFMDTKKKSVLSWSDDKKSIKIVSKVAMDDGSEIKTTEVYKFDGANLVLESSMTAPFGDSTETMVFDKK